MVDLNTKSIKLNNGYQMPLSGLGTYKILDSEVIYQAIKLGIRLFDTALFYNNEKVVGEGIAKAISEKLVKREELFVITKLWMTHYDKVEETITQQLKDLQLDYVDLYLLHWPLRVHDESKNEFQKIPLHKLWANLEALVKKGLTKSIGVSNFNVQLLIDMMTYCEIVPAVNEFELHPYFQRKGLLDFHKKFNIHVIAYGSLIKGSYTEIHTKGKKEYDLLNDEVIVELAKKYEKSTAQIALSWATSQGVTVIPKSSNLERMLSNYEGVNVILKPEDIELLKKLDINKRFCDAIDSFDGYGKIDIFA